MPQVIAVFGAGPGLGASVARRFGREGYSVALVARRIEPLQALADDLTAEGIEAAAFVADLTDAAAAVAAVEAIRERFGRIDVLEYAPISSEFGFIPARTLTATQLRGFLELLLLTPVEVIGAVLPELVERGEGAILIGHGASAVHPMAGFSGVGPVMAAMRNYLHSLHLELEGTGVYVGTLAVTAMIARSAAHDALTSGAFELPEGVVVPLIDPDELADVLWDLTTTRDRVEVLHP
jgi:NADP-dependent 3-hydroxy acid dehydrogenase YdfG